jgi:hypothetical protein
MNHEVQSSPADFERRLALLVDDELNDDARRAVIAELERLGDGWRRCAMGFLSAQTVGRVMREFADELGSGSDGSAPRVIAVAVGGCATNGHAIDTPGNLARLASTVVLQSTEPHPVAGPAVALPDRPSRSPWFAPVVLAASVLVAFGLGALTPWLGDGDPARGPAAGALAGGPSASAYDAGESLVWDPPPGEMVGLLPVSVSNDEAIDVPLYAAHSLDELSQYAPPAVSDEVIRALRARGHDVAIEREYVPLELSNGASAVVPVDNVRIIPVSARPYQ